MRAARGSLLALAFLVCALFAAQAGGASFRHGVIGVRLSEHGGEYAAWSPDSRWIAQPAPAGLKLRNVRTGEVRQVRAPTYREVPGPPGNLAWTPDGTIRYVTSLSLPRDDDNASQLNEVHADGSGFRRQPLGVRALETSWAPQGWPLVFATGPYAFDFEKGPIGPKPSIFVVDEFGSAPRRIALIPHPVGEEGLTEPVISRDGEHIAFTRWGRRSSAQSIWTIGTDGSDPEPLVQGLVATFAVEWSPDSAAIAIGAYTSVRSGQHLYVVPTAGGRMHRIVSEVILDGPAWSPDGRWLAYSTHDGRIWRVHPDGRGRQMIARIPGKELMNLLWSPDGRYLAYTATSPPRSD